jgi:alpha-ribazole phosphatase
MNIYLIRHGQTKWNDDDRYQGSIDIELSEIGLQQAYLLAQRAKELKIEAIFSSDLQRTYKTAEIIKDHTGASLSVDPNLREIHLGEWEGKTWKEIKSEYSEFLEDWFKDMVKTPAPGGESYAELQSRSLKIFDEINKHPIENCAIVTHGAVIKVVLSAFLGLSLEKRANFIISNASISTLSYAELKKNYKIFNINDISHLTHLHA